MTPSRATCALLSSSEFCQAFGLRSALRRASADSARNEAVIVSLATSADSRAASFQRAFRTLALPALLQPLDFAGVVHRKNGSSRAHPSPVEMFLPSESPRHEPVQMPRGPSDFMETSSRKSGFTPHEGAVSRRLQDVPGYRRVIKFGARGKETETTVPRNTTAGGVDASHPQRSHARLVQRLAVMASGDASLPGDRSGWRPRLGHDFRRRRLSGAPGSAVTSGARP
jgi:hypothetical protein